MNSSATLTGCDDIIKRLREAIAEHPLSPILGYAADIAALLDRLDAAERENKSIRDILLRNGFVECDIPACNCGSWHHRYGLPERFHEIKDALADAGHELSNANGNTTLGALNELIEQRDAAERENERLRDWNRQMVEKAASGGTLDDYRELGAKLAAAEAEIERLRATLSHPLLSPTHYCKDCRALWRQCDDFSFNARSTALCDACNNAPCGEQLLPLLPPQPIPAPVIRELNRLRAENEALAADARRYRWLRGREDGRYMTVYAFRTDVDEEFLGEELDATIDAALAAEPSDEV